MRRKGIGTLAAVSLVVLTGCSAGHHTATRTSASANTTFAYLLSMPAVSPDGSQLAWVDVAGVGKPVRVFVAHPDGRGARALGPTWPDGIGAIAWTRDGIVVESNFSVFVLSPTGRATRIAPAGGDTFSAGGSRVATGTAGCGQGSCAGPPVVLDLHSKKRWRLGRPGQSNLDPALSPNGKQVAWATPAGIVVSAVSGGSPQLVAGGGHCPQLSPDGPALAYLAGNSDSLRLVPPSGGAGQTLFKGPSGCPTWSPDSTRIAFVPGTRLSRLSIVNVRTRRVQRISPGLGTAEYFAWTPDGSHLYVSVRPTRAASSCSDLWLLRSATLRGKRLVEGCHLRG